VVIAQHPAAGGFVSSGSQIELVVSRGPPAIDIPPVAGRSSADAGALLQKAGFAVAVERRSDEVAPADTVLATDPVGRAPRDSTVKLVVSSGPAPVAVPDVSQKSYDDAAAALTALRFTVVRRDDFSGSVPNGKVIGTEPAANALAPRGSQITIVVSKGPELVVVPNVKAMTLEQATATLQAQGFQVDTSGYLPGRTLAAQDPAAGEKAPKGSTVTLFFK
jgi:serine/threonine-protein kinase